jgi:hypothetical protein
VEGQAQLEETHPLFSLIFCRDPALFATRIPARPETQSCLFNNLRAYQAQKSQFCAPLWNGSYLPLSLALTHQFFMEPDRLEPDILDSEVVSQLPPAVTQGEKHPVRPGFDRLLFHAQVEPIIRRLFRDQRRYPRFVSPHVVAYLGNAHASRPHQVANISVSGFCMLSEEHWTPGTEMPITLQREEWDGEESSETISLQAIVARCESGEVGFSIALTPAESIAFSLFPTNDLWVSKREMERFLDDLKRPKPPRLMMVDRPRERPLLIAERTERLLEIARLHRLSPASELWHAGKNQSR